MRSTRKLWLALLLLAILALLYYLNCSQLPAVSISIVLSPRRAAKKAGSKVLLYVDNANCSMPNLNPWDKEIRHLLKPGTLVNCGEEAPADRLVAFDRASQKLTVDGELRKSLGSPNCAFRCLNRSDDSPLDWGEWTFFNASVSLPQPCVFVHILCLQPDTSKALNRILDNMQASKETLKRQEGAADQPSVIILGVDATSLSNARRYAPRLLAFLGERLNATLLQHHSVTGHNSRPNLFPLLTGRRCEELENLTSADLLPLIWKNFSAKGYATAFAEDMAACCPIFSNVGKGFAEQPTNAYLRPYFLAVSAENVSRSFNCVERKTNVNILLDYLGRFLKLYDKGPVFSFLWTSTVHDDSSLLATVEEALLKFLERNLERLERSFVIVMGDHGQRQDAIRRTEVGRKEWRLPLMALSVPEAHRARLAPVLSANAHRLTSHYDTFVTLADVLDGGWAETREQRDWSGIAPHGGLSLLRRLPEQRSCRSVGVPAEHCLCQKANDSRPLPPPSPEVVKAAANALVHEINRKLMEGAPDGRCAALSLSVVRSTSRVKLAERTGNSSGVLLIVEALPSQGLFEATVVVPHGNHYNASVLGSITRVNQYGKQAHCLNSTEIAPLCFCA